MKAEDHAPARVPPWIDNRWRLISWLDMHKFGTERLFVLGNSLGALVGNFDDEFSIQWLKGKLRHVEECARELGLRQSEKLAQRQLKRLNGSAKHSKKDARDMSFEIAALIKSELEDTLFFHVPVANAEYYEQNEPLFGQAVFDSFPSLNQDVAEAGKCLALARGTACVFHLMRVMEGGLRSLSAKLGIPYAPSWESHIFQITGKISAKHKTKGVKWKRDEHFFKDVLGDLTAIKIAWRNPTMHIVKSYSVEDAEDILNAVRSFMQHLATRLKEVKRV